jgi:hypothetical protein
MNFTFTRKKAGVFIVGLLASAGLIMLTDNAQTGALLMVGVIAYLASK